MNVKNKLNNINAQFYFPILVFVFILKNAQNDVTLNSGSKKHDHSSTTNNLTNLESTTNGSTFSSSYKIVHKDQESIHGFCLYEVLFLF